MPTQKTRNGLTLLELIIALSIIMAVTGGLFIAFRQPERQHLENAALQLQADIRYAQRRAIAEGRRFRVEFTRSTNRYRIMALRPDEELRVVYFQNGVRLDFPISHHLEFLPTRGTPGDSSLNVPARYRPEGGSVTIRLETRRYFQEISIVPSGGRADIKPIEPIN